jgi:putative oxidoreductase
VEETLVCLDGGTQPTVPGMRKPFTSREVARALEWNPLRVEPAASHCTPDQPCLSMRNSPSSRYSNVLFGGSPVATVSANFGLLLLRVFTGLALAFAHGMGKVPPSDRFINRTGEMGFPVPEVFAWLAALAEFGGGLLLAIGLLTRPVGAFVAVHFAVVVFLAHAGDPFGARELGAFFGVTALMFALVGPGRYSLDALIRTRL